ncbi:DUF5677 domain-containing protein [Streptomyces sp. NPDC087901]|uniref:DUF5677 domain-containing protein n=1 Tax=Streptomyces sp. NPDC087901 TaxID=3365818 RepID=UPI0038164D42
MGLVCRTSEAVLLLIEQGFTIEAAPLVRNIFNHAYAEHWLADNGDPAVDALVARGDEERERLCKKLEATGWPQAAEFRSAMNRAAERPAPVRSEAEQKLHAKLKHELKVFTAGSVRENGFWPNFCGAVTLSVVGHSVMVMCHHDRRRVGGTGDNAGHGRSQSGAPDHHLGSAGLPQTAWPCPARAVAAMD